MRPKVIVCGAAGRMGKRIISLAVDAGRFEIIAAIENQDEEFRGERSSLELNEEQ